MKKKFLCLFLLLTAAAFANARTKTSLNNGWKFLKADAANAQGIGFDDSSWQRINIPHTWNVEDPWDDEPGYHRGAATWVHWSLG